MPHFKMLLVIGLSSRVFVASGFRAAAPKSSFTRTHALHSTQQNAGTSFLDSIGKAFSSTMSSASSSNDPAQAFYTIGITGAGGLVGTALRNELLVRKTTVNGKPVRIVSLARGSVASPDDEVKLLAQAGALSDTRITWNPKGKTPDEILPVASELDAIVHLAGENIATGRGPLGFLGLRPWTAEKKAEILNSRVDAALALSKVLSQKSQNNNKPSVFLAASGIGAYGDNFIGDLRPAVDESAPISTAGGFLADVSREIEAATEPPTGNASRKYRVVNMRFGVVLSKNGGALAKLYPIFLLGGGGIVGSGQQYFSYISARDVARAIVHTLETPSLTGPVNFCAPNPCTNAEFTKALGKALFRPTIVPLPAFVVSLLFGEMGEETLLGGVRAIPTRLSKSGFEFIHPTIDQAIQGALTDEV